MRPEMHLTVLLLLLCTPQLASATPAFCQLSVLPPVLVNHPHFGGWTIAQICKIMGTTLVPPVTPAQPNPPPASVPIPSSFDWRTTNQSYCIAPIQDQGQCGSCWAFSSTTAFASRVCIASPNVTSSLLFSPQDLVNCDQSCIQSRCDNGCNGGYLDVVWAYLNNNGVVTSACQPYVGSSQSCSSTCTAQTNPNKITKATSYYTLTSVADMQRSIMTYGPISAGMDVTQSFLSYSSGVYIEPANDPDVGGHAVTLIGWGTDTGTDYWIGVNQWSTNWGENGFFRIRRGTNEAQIESYVVAGGAPSTTASSANSADSIRAVHAVSKCLVWVMVVVVVVGVAVVA